MLEDKSYSETDLHATVLNFIALLCTEELKFKVKVQGRGDVDFPYITDCLDSAGMCINSAAWRCFLSIYSIGWLFSVLLLDYCAICTRTGRYGFPYHHLLCTMF